MTYDMREAISKIDNIPLVKESIPELTKLANGFDPSIPGYLALGRLYQITNLAESAKAAEPPQGTIKDKTTQAAGLMALMGGRGQMAAQNSAAETMKQPGPVPQNTPEPEMQMEANPEEMMGMADGGITSMDIDPRMFNFNEGGIVAFANPEKEKKQLVKEKEEEKTSTIGNMLRDILASISLPASEIGDSVYKAGQAFGTSPGLLEELTPSQRAAKERAAEEIRNPTPKVSPEEMAKRNEQNRLRASFEEQYRQGNTATSPFAGTPLISPAMQKATNMQPPKPPMGGINNGKTPVPGANIPAIGAGTPQALPENKFLTATEGFIKQAPEVFNEDAETRKLNARNEAAGIGTYAKVMREQQQQLRDQFERSRPTMNEGIVGALRAYARPGARAGDVGGEITGQMREDREARMQFAQDQFKVTEAIEKLEEARRTGNVDKIAAAEAAVRKANADLRNHQMTAAASAANTQGRSMDSAADRAQQLQIENAKLQVKKAELAQLGRDPEAIRILKQVEALEAQGKTKEALALIEKLGQIHAAMSGARYTGKSTAPTETQIRNAIRDQHRLENQMNFMTLTKKNAKPAEKAAAQAAIDATEKRVRADMTRGTDGGGGGGSMSPQDKQALEWANSNPNDPRSAQIKKKLGV